jgi:hypothetical protein
VAPTTDPLTYDTVVLEGGDNIDITNPDGVNGNPLISLSQTLTQLTSLETQGIHIEGNTLRALNNDLTTGNLELQSSGTNGVIDLNSVAIDQQGNMTGVKNLTMTGNLSGVFPELCQL